MLYRFIGGILKIKNSKLLVCSLFFVFLGLFSVKHAFADTLNLSGSVATSTGSDVSEATVEVDNVNTTTAVASTVTDSSGKYSLSIPSGTYDVHVTPPSGSNYFSIIAPNIAVSSNTTINFIFAPAGSVTLSGHIYDALGNALPNQDIYLSSGGNTIVFVTTDSSGSYSLQAAPGTYTLNVTNDGTDYSQNIPGTYQITKTNYSLSQSAVVNITLPMKKVSMHVQDLSSNAMSGVELRTNNSGSSSGLSLGGNITNASGTSSYGINTSGSTTDNSGNVALWLIPNSGTSKYTFTAFPPSGSNFVTTIFANNSITADTNLTITMQQPVTLSGHVYDALGNPLPGQDVSLNSGGNTIALVTTDSSGSYSVQAAPATYTLNVTNDGTDYSQNIPGTYQVTKAGYLLSQNTTLDINLSLKKVSIHVQDAAGNPISGVGLSTNSPSNTLTMGSISNATVSSSYGINTFGPLTNSSGDVALWLFPTSGTHKYNFTAIPPSGSIYLTFNVNNISVTGDQSELISLQYNHATPVTTATLSPTADGQGNYSDPTTVTLSTTAASGYTIANTYYTLDGGSQQKYSSPFTVSGSGSHTITYWSVDNSGIPEALNTKTFTILTAGPTLVTAINAGGDTQGNYVADTDFSGGSPYSSSATVDMSGVTNPAPQAVYQTVRYGNTFSYTIPNLNPSGTYTVKLHFNELYWGTALSGNSGGLGSRVFNVAINGSQVLSNYDIFAKAGGSNIAITEQFPVTPDSNGNVTIAFTTVTDNAMVNGIELYSGTLPSPTPTPTPTPTTSVLINAGGSTVGNFHQDNSYSGGTTYTSNASVDTSNVTSPAPEAVYQSVRYGNFTYNVGHLFPNQTYNVKLHFNELYWGTALAGGNGGVGSRIFNVTINGSRVLSNYDIFQDAGGANVAVVKSFTTTSDSNGKITIQFSTVTDNAMVNGIEISQ